MSNGKGVTHLEKCQLGIDRTVSACQFASFPASTPFAAQNPADFLSGSARVQDKIVRTRDFSVFLP